MLICSDILVSNNSLKIQACCKGSNIEQKQYIDTPNKENSPTVSEPIDSLSNKTKTNDNSIKLSSKGFNIKNISIEPKAKREAISIISMPSNDHLTISDSKHNSVMSIVNQLTDLNDNSRNANHNQSSLSLSFKSNKSKSNNPINNSVKDLHFTYYDNDEDDRSKNKETNRNDKLSNRLLNKGKQVNDIIYSRSINYKYNKSNERHITNKSLNKCTEGNNRSNNYNGNHNRRLSKEISHKNISETVGLCPLSPLLLKDKNTDVNNFNEQDYIKHSKTNTLRRRDNIYAMQSPIKGSHMIQWQFTNHIGDLFKEKVVIDSKGVLLNIDNMINFGYEAINSNNEIINHVILNKPSDYNEEAYSLLHNKTLFSIIYNSNSKKFFFKPCKYISKKFSIQIAYSISSTYQFCTSQKIKICSTVIEITPINKR